MRIAIHTITLLALASCTSTEPKPLTWTSTVRTWGTIREALRDGKTDARINLADAVTPYTIAVGAAIGLDGEITIVDGDCYISSARGGKIETLRSPRGAATILFAADVHKWQTIAIKEDLDSSALPAFITKSAQDAGINTSEPFPFIIEGDLVGLQIHVLAGECPIRARILGVKMSSPPYRNSFGKIHGRLVGIHASQGGGVITHHGSTTHMHAIVKADEIFTGHADTVSISAGAVLRLPSSR